MVTALRNMIIAVCLPLFFWILNSGVTAQDQFLVSGQERSIDGDTVPLTLYDPSSPIELHPSAVDSNLMITPSIQGFSLISKLPGNHYEGGPDPSDSMFAPGSLILNTNHLQNTPTLNGKRRLPEGESVNKERTNNSQTDAPMPYHHDYGLDSKTILLFIACGIIFWFVCDVLCSRYNRRWRNCRNRIRNRNRNRNGNAPGDRELQPQNQQPAQVLMPFERGFNGEV